MSTLIQIKSSGGGGGASGIWGISNASGVYTYYTTLTLAMAAAVSGQVIEMFADVTETGAVTITLKPGVNINGNGHTYNHTNATAVSTFLVADSINTDATILNLNVVKSSSTGACLYLGTNGTGQLIFTGSKLINLGTGFCVNQTANADYEIIGLYAKSNTNTAISVNGPEAKLTNCTAYSTSGTGIIVTGSNAQISNCTARSNSGYGLYINSGRITDCVGVSASQIGILVLGGSMNNCKGFSSGNAGITAYYCNIYSCYGFSSASVGLQMVNTPTIATDCTGVSSASYGIQSSDSLVKTLLNCTAISSAAAALFLYGEAINCSIICNWNNVGGHGILLNNVATITNCTIKTTNASANSINAASAITAKYANNSYIGATTPINANVTQGIINTQDNQGNILIN